MFIRYNNICFNTHIKKKIISNSKNNNKKVLKVVFPAYASSFSLFIFCHTAFMDLCAKRVMLCFSNTLCQDFYSHSNWVEMGQRSIYIHLLQPEEPAIPVAKGNSDLHICVYRNTHLITSRCGSEDGRWVNIFGYWLLAESYYMILKELLELVSEVLVFLRDCCCVR